MKRPITTIACEYPRSLGSCGVIVIGQLWGAQVLAADYDVGSIHITQTWA
jgi:hypothetical protein